jgi:hypothetical protein
MPRDQEEGRDNIRTTKQNINVRYRILQCADLRMEGYEITRFLTGVHFENAYVVAGKTDGKITLICPLGKKFNFLVTMELTVHPHLYNLENLPVLCILCKCRHRSQTCIIFILYTRILCYLTTHVTPNSDCSAWRQAAQRSPLYQFAVS